MSRAGCRPCSPVSIGLCTGAGARKVSTTYAHQRWGLEKWDTAGKRASLRAPPPRRGTQDVTPQCRTPPSPIGTTLGWRDPGIARDPQTGTGLGMVVPTSMLAVRPCQRHAKDGAAFLLLQFGGLLPSGTVSAPPSPMSLHGGVGRGQKGLRGSRRRSHGPAARRGHRAGPTGVWAKHLAKGISE